MHRGPARVAGKGNMQCLPQGDVHRDRFWSIFLGIYRDNGKEHGNYYIVMPIYCGYLFCLSYARSPEIFAAWRKRSDKRKRP